MGYKSRKHWIVGIEFCPKCKKRKDVCCCGKKENWDEVKKVMDLAVKEREKE